MVRCRAVVKSEIAAVRLSVEAGQSGSGMDVPGSEAAANRSWPGLCSVCFLTKQSRIFFKINNQDPVNRSNPPLLCSKNVKHSKFLSSSGSQNDNRDNPRRPSISSPFEASVLYKQSLPL
jgi:hypothetical protein